MSPPSLGHFTPVGIERVPRHLGNLLQPRNSPLRLWRLSIIEPHSGHLYSVGSAFAFSPLSGRVNLQVLGWFSQPMYGPKKPAFGSSLPPQSGHFSVASADRSCASPISPASSTFCRRRANGL